MKGNNGFSFVEIIVSVSIILTITSIAVPIGSKLQAERQKLSDRRLIGQILHDDMQRFIYGGESALPFHESKMIRNRNLSFSFQKENEYVEGCVSWKNAIQKQESICLYGLQQG